MKTYFAANLGAYTTDRALSTLPNQLNYLRVFRDVANPDVALVYRLHTERRGADHAPFFSILCIGRTGRSLLQSEAAALLDSAAVTFLPAWPFSNTHGEIGARFDTSAWLEPANGDQMNVALKSDWSMLVDFMRRRATPISVSVVCRPNLKPAPTSSAELRRAEISVTTVGDEIPALNFFNAIAGNPEAADRSLQLHVVIESKGPVDRVTMQTVGRLLLGVRTVTKPTGKSIYFPSDNELSHLRTSPELALRLFHPPYGHIQGRGLSSDQSTFIPLSFEPSRKPDVILGHATVQRARGDVAVPVGVTAADRMRHIYIVGKTGSGKTNLLKNLIRQDIQGHAGIAVLDPHGELAEFAVTHSGSRESEITYLDFGDPKYVPVVNPLSLDVRSDSDFNLASEDLIEVLIRRSFHQYTGPVFEDSVRLLLETLREPIAGDVDLLTIPAALTLMQDERGRKWAARVLRESRPDLSERWRTFNSMQPGNLMEHVRWVTSKFSDFSGSGVLPLTTGAHSNFSLTELVRRRKILIVRLPEAQIGNRAASFIGAHILTRIRRAALDLTESGRRPFYVYADEFQKFTTTDVEDLVAEARKFGLGLVLAHQNLRQLDGFSRFEAAATTHLREALFGNVGTLIAMRVSGYDVQHVSSELQLPDRDVRNIRQYGALARTISEGQETRAFSMTVPHAEHADRGEANAAAAARRIRARMISEGLWQRRDSLARRVNAESERLMSSWSLRRDPDPSPFAGKASTRFTDATTARKRDNDEI